MFEKIQKLPSNTYFSKHQNTHNLLIERIQDTRKQLNFVGAKMYDLLKTLYFLHCKNF